MLILHLSYAKVSDYNDPEKWLNRLRFFTIMLEQTARYAEIKSVHLINYSGVKDRNGVEYHFLKKQQWQILFPLQLHQYLKKLKPDIIVVHGLVFPWQILWLRAQFGRAVKLILVHHSEKPLRYHKRLLQKLADRFIDAYFFTSIELAKMWMEAGLIRDVSKIHELMIGSSVFYPIDRALSQTRTRVQGPGIYLWVGNFDANKDPITLIAAFKLFVAHHPHQKIYLIYQKEGLLENIRPLLEGCHQIVLVGKVVHEELLYWYNSVDFIVSTSHYEGGGVAVCEGMSCGCIPILTNIPSFMMMTDHGKVGLLFKPGNIGDLCKALLKSTTLDLTEERNRVLDHFHKQLSNEAIVEKMMCVFKSI